MIFCNITFTSHTFCYLHDLVFMAFPITSEAVHFEFTRSLVSDTVLHYNLLPDSGSLADFGNLAAVEGSLVEVVRKLAAELCGKYTEIKDLCWNHPEVLESDTLF